MFTTPSQASIHHRLSPYSPPPPCPTFPQQSEVHCCLCPLFFSFIFNLSRPAPPPHSASSCQLTLNESVTILLVSSFCLFGCLHFPFHLIKIKELPLLSCKKYIKLFSILSYLKDWFVKVMKTMDFNIFTIRAYSWTFKIPSMNGKLRTSLYLKFDCPTFIF